ncbi:hypothetical protein VTK73DRAFT_1012 [Phialemonium thermophilum]|uniref:Uncharacterized protein n=1 Tax=Phialemonium thermophilum TaxID=223376 RepID=A0ABR3XBY1_9PEZI
MSTPPGQTGGNQPLGTASASGSSATGNRRRITLSREKAYDTVQRKLKIMEQKGYDKAIITYEEFSAFVRETGRLYCVPLVTRNRLKKWMDANSEVTRRWKFQIQEHHPGYFNATDDDVGFTRPQKADGDAEEQRGSVSANEETSAAPRPAAVAPVVAPNMNNIGILDNGNDTPVHLKDRYVAGFGTALPPQVREMFSHFQCIPLEQMFLVSALAFENQSHQYKKMLQEALAGPQEELRARVENIESSILPSPTTLATIAEEVCKVIEEEAADAHNIARGLPTDEWEEKEESGVSVKKEENTSAEENSTSVMDIDDQPMFLD